MVYGIVRRHNADLKIQSEIGKGTTICIVFRATNMVAPKDTAPTDCLPACRRILVVDDDSLLIKSLRDALEEDGHRVLTASGGQEGIDAFRAAEKDQERFALVITDLGMPHVDGRKVAAAVKAASPNTPVILLTGWGERLTTEEEIPHVDCVLSKPPKLIDLREALNRLSVRALQQSLA